MKKLKILALALSLIMALAPLSVFAEGETPKYAMDPTHITFASQADYDAIVTKVNESEVTLENGEIKAVTKDLAETPDPYIEVSLENLETSINAEDYPYCALVYKCPMTNDWKENIVSQMYFSLDDSEYGEDLTCYANVAVGDRYAYTIFNPGVWAGWSGTITSLRLDYFYSHYLKDNVPTPIPEGETMYIHDVMFFADEASARSAAGTLAFELNQAGSVERTYDMDPTHVVFATEDDYNAVMYRDDGKDPGKRTILSYEEGHAKFTVNLGDTTADPYVYVSYGKLLTSILAEDYPYCAIVYKMPADNSSANNQLDVYFNTKGNFPVDNSQMLSASTKANGSYQVAIYNPGSLNDWNGVVTSIRLDYLNNSMTDGDVFYVHDIIFAADQQSARTAANDIATMLNVPDEATLSFNVGDYGEKPEDQIITKGNLPVQPEDPVATEMLFDGWYTSKTYNTPFDFTKPLTKERVVAYAKWVSGLKVSFVCPEGTENVPATQVVKKNARATEPTAPTLEGKEFYGWYTDEQFTNEYSFNSLVKEDVVLYALFDEPAQEYAITVIGGTASVDSAKAGTEVTVTANEPEEGMKFDHWNITGMIEFMNEEDKDGKNASFTFLSCEGGATLEAVFVADGLYGDVTGDGKINSRDVIAVMKAVVAGTSAEDLPAADLNGDGKINSRDVIAVMKAVLEA